MKTDIIEDITFFLYLAPILISGIYGLATLLAGELFYAPSEIFLLITKDSNVFLAGVLTVCIAVLLEIKFLGGEEKRSRDVRIARNVMLLAFFCFISALILALGFAGFNLSLASNLILTGRYSLIYPTFLIVLSVLLRLRVVQGFTSRTLIDGGTLLLPIVSIFILYGLWRVGAEWYIVLSAPLFLILVSVAFRIRRMKPENSGQTQ